MKKRPNTLWTDELGRMFHGRFHIDKETRVKYEHDASIFSITPQAVLFPKDSSDLKKVVNYVSAHKKHNPGLSLTARAGGTDMTGGPLTDSLLLEFTRHMGKLVKFDSKNQRALVQPGLYYKDLDKKASKNGLYLPSYPASKSICCLGGMIANNAGGEKTPAHGKTIDYVERLRVVLSDGNEYEFKKLGLASLKKKMKQRDFEGSLYRKMHALLEKNYDLIQKARPRVHKNSAGYYLWRVWDRVNFDLTQLFTGSQGTLGLITEAEISLIKKKKHSRLIVCFIDSTEALNELVTLVLPHRPESLETYDDQTLRLGMKFMKYIAQKLGRSYLSLLWDFKREGLRMMFKGFPAFTVLVAIEDDKIKVLEKRVEDLHRLFKARDIAHMVMKNEKDAEKYWMIRRESFNLLRHKIKGKQAAPFIDDFSVPPEALPEFWPRLEKILQEHNLEVTIAGHAGSGNYHIIPLMDLNKPSDQNKITVVSEKVYRLVTEFGGSITAEHNDGLVRTNYLPLMFEPQVIKIFQEVKEIFDPQNLFNPGKKVFPDWPYALRHLRSEHH